MLPFLFMLSYVSFFFFLRSVFCCCGLLLLLLCRTFRMFAFFLSRENFESTFVSVSTAVGTDIV